MQATTNESVVADGVRGADNREYKSSRSGHDGLVRSGGPVIRGDMSIGYGEQSECG